MQKQKRENPFSGMSREKIILEAKKQILHSALLALAALVVIGVACYAWFVGNNGVTAKIGAISMSVDAFELASKGSAGIYDNAYLGVADGESLLGGLMSTKGKRTVRWRMEQDNNLRNTDEDQKGIHPNTEGTLKFYVIPQMEGPLTLKCRLNITPLNSNKDALSGGTEEKLMRGHLLFAYSYEDGTGNTDSGMVQVTDGSFTLTFPEAKKDDQYEVTLNWFWPYVLGDARERPDYGETIELWTKDQNMCEYFYYNGGQEIVIADTSYRRLSSYYNLADQCIGDRVSAVILELEAERA